MKKVVILADDMMPGVQELLGCWVNADGAAPRVMLQRFAGRALQAADLAGADALLVRSVTAVNAGLLGPHRPRFIGSATIGTDHLDIAFLQREGIAYSAAPGCNAVAVAEWVMASVLQHHPLLRQQPESQVVAVVGMGQVGRRVAQRLSAWGCRVLAVDPLLSEWARAQISAVQWCTLDDALTQADVLCLHTPLTRSGDHATLGLISTAELARLKPQALILNAGRGGVLDEQALLQSPSRPLILDVFADEPAINAAVVARALQVSPHIAGHSVEGKWRGTWQVLTAMAEQLGWRCIKPFDEVMPWSAPPVLAWQANQPWREQLAQRLTEIVQPMRQDGVLRADCSAAAFDTLRKGYGIRREWAAYQFSAVPRSSPAYPVLQAWGFRC